MERLAALPSGRETVRRVWAAGLAYAGAYSLAALLSPQPSVVLGNLAQLVPPLAFAAIALRVASRSRGQVRAFWHLNAAYGLLWAAGQAVWTYLDVFGGGIPVVSPTDPIFFATGLPLAAALYGRPDRDRPRWLFDIALLDIALIAIFAIFLFLYFVVSIAVTDGSEHVYNAHLTQLFNARSLLLAVWAVVVWRTAGSDRWRRMLGMYAAGLVVMFVGGILYDVIEAFGSYTAGGLGDLGWIMPFILLSVAAAHACDDRLFEPAEEAPPLARLPAVSLIALALLVAIPVIDELSRLTLDVSPEAQALRTRISLAVMIPFGIVVFVREFLSRRALLAASQQLVDTREQLARKEKLAAVGQLVAGVAHELNNPLQGVLGHADLMALENGDGRSDEELKAIRDNAARAAAVVRDLLAFAGRSSPSFRWQPLNDLVRRAIARRRPAIEAAGIQLEAELGPDLPLACVDTSLLESALVHLIENAENAVAARIARQSAAQAGGPPAPGRIVVTTLRARRPDRLVVEVADNGTGLPRGDENRIFDPFFTTDPGSDAMGLGLSVCYGIAREHGGRLTARNRARGGAVFSLELPIAAEQRNAV